MFTSDVGSTIQSLIVEGSVISTSASSGSITSLHHQSDASSSYLLTLSSLVLVLDLPHAFSKRKKGGVT